MRNDHDDRIDAAIDAAAQSLTAAEPSAALRAAVRDRINGRGRTAWWLVPVGAMAAVSVVMIMGWALLGPPGGPDRGRSTDVRRTEYVSTPKPALAAPVVDPAPSQIAERVLSGRPGGPNRVRPTDVPPPEELEPLIPPLMIAPLEAKLIAVDTSSGVTPIEIEPLRIEPLQGE